MAEDSYGLVDKYMRKLDHELLKFKLELEADNRGITEILEKHSLEMDQPSSAAAAIVGGALGLLGGGAGGVAGGNSGSHHHGHHLKENRHPKKHVSIQPKWTIRQFTVALCRIQGRIFCHVGRLSFGF